MSPRKLTEDDKQEILYQYRNSEATTSTLAKSYEVSSSTISRFLKNRLSSAEYEDLIQQKRLARTPRGEKSSGTKTSAKKKKTTAKSKKAEPVAAEEVQEPLVEPTVAKSVEEPELPQEPKPTITRRRRRSTALQPEPEPEPVTSVTADKPEEDELEKPPAKLILDRRTSNESEDVPKSDRLILRSDRIEPEEEDEDDAVDLITLKEMLGEDLEDINDEEDEEDEDWDEDETVSYPERASSISNIQILPLSQASFPRTCYLVIDRSAELIVKPLADFADLGSIPDAEVRQQTLPVFDNHHIAKRFSHRRERVIKVPDGRMIQKTSHHLQDKGITRLLIDGQIYSLSN